MPLWLRYLTQLLVVTSPLLSGSFSLLNFFGKVPDQKGVVSLFGLSVLTGPKDSVEFNLKLSLALILFVISVVNEWVTVGQPLERIRVFRTHFLDGEYENDWKLRLGDGCRINVMYLRRRIYTLGLQVFQWVWHANFTDGRRADANMFLFAFQGVAGEAIRYAREGGQQGDEKGLFVIFDEPAAPRRTFRERFFSLKVWKQRFSYDAWEHEYFLTEAQIQRTKHVLAVLSIPILLEAKTQEGSKKNVCVGLINIDAVTPEGVKILMANKAVLADHFAQIGRYLSELT